jgi:hypothetical protein
MYFQTIILLMMLSLSAIAQTESSIPRREIGTHGVSALLLLANFSYAGMRAQGSKDRFLRIIAFIFGFPGTLLSLIVMRDGSERAYGVDLPKRP